MRLLLFNDGDAPNLRAPETANNITYDSNAIQLKVKSNENVQWVGLEEYRAPNTASSSQQQQQQQTSKGSVAARTFLLELDDGSLVPLDSIVSMRSMPPHPIGGQSSEAITDDFTQGVDFRTQKGKKMDVERQEYGKSFRTAAAKPISMNADAVREKRQEKDKRDRERTVAEIEEDGQQKKVDDDHEDHDDDDADEEVPPGKKRSTGHSTSKKGVATK